MAMIGNLPASYLKRPALVRAPGVISPIGTPLPVGTIVYAGAMYELPPGVPGAGDVMRLRDDVKIGAFQPPTDRSKMVSEPSYPG